MSIPIELIYHFTVNFGKRMEEVNMQISVELPRSKLEIETICDYVRGVLITEREKMEMLGVNIIGIPDDRRCFLPDDFPKGVYPWRRTIYNGNFKVLVRPSLRF